MDGVFVGITIGAGAGFAAWVRSVAIKRSWPMPNLWAAAALIAFFVILVNVIAPIVVAMSGYHR